MFARSRKTSQRGQESRGTKLPKAAAMKGEQEFQRGWRGAGGYGGGWPWATGEGAGLAQGPLHFPAS